MSQRSPATRLGPTDRNERACYTELEAFERALHGHVHLESNVLFPAAAQLEQIE